MAVRGVKIAGLRSFMARDGNRPRVGVAVDGHPEPRPDRPGRRVEIDEDCLKTDRHLHWQRKLPVRPDGV